MKKGTIMAAVAMILGFWSMGVQEASANCDPTIQTCFGARPTTTTAAPTTTTTVPPTTTEAPTTTAPVTTTTEVTVPPVQPAVQPEAVTEKVQTTTTVRPRVTTTTVRPRVTATTEATTTTVPTGDVPGDLGERSTTNECPPLGDPGQKPGNPWVPYLLGCGSGLLLVAGVRRRTPEADEADVAAATV